jgi:hypothetical protein
MNLSFFLLIFLFKFISVAQGRDGIGFVAVLEQRNLNELEDKFWKVSNPASNEYGKYLTVEKIAQIIGITSEEENQLRNWLESMGAWDIELLKTRDYVHFKMDQTSRFSTMPSSSIKNLMPTSVRSLIKWFIRDGENKMFQIDETTRQDALWMKKKRLMTKKFFKSDAPLGSPNEQKKAYGIPIDQKATNSSNLQMVSSSKYILNVI